MHTKQRSSEYEIHIGPVGIWRNQYLSFFKGIGNNVSEPFSHSHIVNQCLKSK